MRTVKTARGETQTPIPIPMSRLAVLSPPQNLFTSPPTPGTAARQLQALHQVLYQTSKTPCLLQSHLQWSQSRNRNWDRYQPKLHHCSKSGLQPHLGHRNLHWLCSQTGQHPWGLTAVEPRHQQYVDILHMNIPSYLTSVQFNPNPLCAIRLQRTHFITHIMYSPGLCHWYSQPTLRILCHWYSSRRRPTLRFLHGWYIGRRSAGPMISGALYRPSGILWYDTRTIRSVLGYIIGLESCDV